MIALHAADQLRQRQAWALSQIVTISSPSIENSILTERRVSYTDILVRNAFKSYRNILKVSLTYIFTYLIFILY